MFGGHDISMNFFHDVHLLDTKNWIWHNISTASAPTWGPGPMWRHMAAVDDDQLIVSSHDGIHESCIYSFKLETAQWTSLVLCGAAPCPRFGHTITNVGAGRMLLFGGCTDNFTFNDTLALDLHLPWHLERWLWKGQRFCNGCLLSSLSQKLLTQIIATILWLG